VFTLCFSLTGSVGFWLGVHYRRGGRFFFVLQVFQNCWFEDVGPRGFLGGPEGEINFKR
jgi:hypothetical protein